MAYVYISYCEETRRAAEALRAKLEDRRQDVWLVTGDLFTLDTALLRQQVAGDAACAVILVPGDKDPGETDLPDWAKREQVLLESLSVPVIPAPAGRLNVTSATRLRNKNVRLHELLIVPSLGDIDYDRALVNRILKLIQKNEAENTVKLGRWQMVKNGPEEPLEWRILARDGEKLLLICRFGLEPRWFSVEHNGKWDNCSLRRWLNDDFLHTAFREEEREAILETDVEPDFHPDYDTDPGLFSTDRLFVLSLSEYEKYFSNQSNALRRCWPTPLAKLKGAFAWGGETCLWWLRTPGIGDNMMTYVNAAGGVDLQGCYAQRGEVCIRPAMWVDRTRLPHGEAPKRQAFRRKSRGAADTPSSR